MLLNEQCLWVDMIHFYICCVYKYDTLCKIVFAKLKSQNMLSLGAIFNVVCELFPGPTNTLGLFLPRKEWTWLSHWCGQM